METQEKQKLFNSILEQIEKIVTGSLEQDEKLAAVCNLLKDKVSYYDWVGFYFVDPSRKNELIIGPYVGEPTEHPRISFGQGICGQAAERMETFVVQDVSKERNYLSCSTKVQSEIVVPYLKNGKIVGELDIDSHELAPFTDADKTFLENVCEKITDFF